MRKGENTKDAILREALDLSSAQGLEGLSLGNLAKSLGMSKSGLFAHFASKQALQLQVLDAAAERFTQTVISPGLKAPRGLPRLRSVFAHWMHWEKAEFQGGCPFISASFELDSQESPVRERLQKQQQVLFQTIHRLVEEAIAEGHLKPDLDPGQSVFEIWGLLLSYHHYARMMDAQDATQRAERAFDSLMERMVHGLGT